MTDHAKIRRGLEERLEEITTRAKQIDEDLSQPADDDWDEEATESADDEVLERVGRASLEEAEHIRRALAALDAGTYGVCTSCGETIAPERLEVLPEATRCQHCA